MAIDAAISIQCPASVRVAVGRLASPLTVLVVASAAVRTLAALAHSTPRYYPDEYIYAELGRSLARGDLAVRGHTAHFPALLEPLLQAPFWLLDDVGTSLHAIQAAHALVVSLVAVPVYVLAGRLGLPSWQRLTCAALALCSPSLVYSAYLTADALALPLALGAVAAAVGALERPSTRRQVLFLLLAGLATAARVQYVVLPVAFVLAAIVVDGAPTAALRRFRVTLVALALPVVAALAAGPDRVLGYYDAVLSLDVEPAAAARWAAVDVALTAFSAGWVLVPLALIGLATALARPRDPAERAFGVVTLALAALLLTEAALYASNGSERFQERYLMLLPPLVPLLFFAGARRLPARRATIGAVGLSLGLLLLAARMPLATYTASFGKQDSPLLQAAYRLEDVIGTGDAGLVVALGAGLLALAAAGLASRPQRGVALIAALAAVTLAGTSAGAVAYDVAATNVVRSSPLAAEPEAVDRATLGPTALLLTPGADRASVFEQLFWNRSIDELLRLDGADEVDAFGSGLVAVAADGRLSSDGVPLRKPLLVQEYGARLELAGARLVERTAATALWRPVGDLRLAMLTEGRYWDGWLAPRSSVTIWPAPDGPRRGTLTLSFSNPRKTTVSLVLHAAPGLRRVVRIAPRATRRLALPVAATKAWRLELSATRSFGVSGLRLAAARLAVPRFDEGSRSH